MYTVKIDGTGIAKACDAYVAAFDKSFYTVGVSLLTMFDIVRDRFHTDMGFKNLQQAVQVIRAKEGKDLSQRVGEASAHLFAAAASMAYGTVFMVATASAISSTLTRPFWLKNPVIDSVLIGSTIITCTRVVAVEISDCINATGFPRKLMNIFGAVAILTLPFNMYRKF